MKRVREPQTAENKAVEPAPVSAEACPLALTLQGFPIPVLEKITNLPIKASEPAMNSPCPDPFYQFS